MARLLAAVLLTLLRLAFACRREPLAALALLAAAIAAFALPPVTLYPQVPLARVAVKDSWVRPRANISGKVTLVAREDDGDWHFRVVDDAGNFVVCEIIPELPMPHPRVGDRVWVWGIVRWDLEHRWGEIHPVVGIKVIGK